MARRMPTKPTVAEKIEPMKKAMARPQTICGAVFGEASAAKYSSTVMMMIRNPDDAKLAI